LLAHANIRIVIALKMPTRSIKPPTPRANKIKTITSSINTMPPRLSKLSINSTPDSIVLPVYKALNESNIVTPWNKNAQMEPNNAPVKITGIAGILIANKAITITAGISIYQDTLKNSVSEAIVVSTRAKSPPVDLKKNPVIKKPVPAITKAGKLTYNIDFICSTISTFVKDAVITVVSDNGDNLSPT